MIINTPIDKSKDLEAKISALENLVSSLSSQVESKADASAISQLQTNITSLTKTVNSKVGKWTKIVNTNSQKYYFPISLIPSAFNEIMFVFHNTSNIAKIVDTFILSYDDYNTLVNGGALYKFVPVDTSRSTRLDYNTNNKQFENSNSFGIYAYYR